MIRQRNIRTEEQRRAAERKLLVGRRQSPKAVPPPVPLPPNFFVTFPDVIVGGEFAPLMDLPEDFSLALLWAAVGYGGRGH